MVSGIPLSSPKWNSDAPIMRKNSVRAGHAIPVMKSIARQPPSVTSFSEKSEVTKA